MGKLYAWSLAPVLSVALMLCLGALMRQGPALRGLAALCAAIAAWALSLLMASLPEVAPWGRRFAAVGAFVAAGYLHAAYELLQIKRRGLVWLAYGIAAGITSAGAMLPGLLYDPINLSAGPMFWPAMALAVCAATLPMWALWRAAQRSDEPRPALALLGAGVACYGGSWTNALLLSRGQASPLGLFVVLASLLVIARIIAHYQTPLERRLLDRSLLFSSLMALLSAAYLFGLLSVIDAQASALTGQYRLGALFLLAMAAIALEPLRLALQRRLGRWLFGDRRQQAQALAEALSAQEALAAQHERLAQLGTLVAAIAHEVRNPLGVIQAHVKVLELQGASAPTLEAIREQLGRASGFLDELLQYGRPTPLQVREVELEQTLRLAATTAQAARHELALQVNLQVQLEQAELPARVEADQAQLTQLLMILVDNALLAVHARPGGQLGVVRVSAQPHAASPGEVLIHVEDNGPGIDPAVADRLFEPFVTSRPRSGPARGSGLGLAIARSIAQRHGGTLAASPSPTLGGARLTLTLPARQPTLAAASAASDLASEA